MHSHYYNKSMTIMGQLEELSISSKLKSNLQRIYNQSYSHTYRNNRYQEKQEGWEKYKSILSHRNHSPILNCENEKSNGQQDEKLNKNSSYGNILLLSRSRKTPNKYTTHTPITNDSYKYHNYSQMLKTSHEARMRSREKQISKQNIKIAKKIASAKSYLTQGLSRNHKQSVKQNEEQGRAFSAGKNQFVCSKLINKSTNEAHNKSNEIDQSTQQRNQQRLSKIKQKRKQIMLDSLGYRKMKSSSAVNRSKEERRINYENGQLKNRLINAMSKSIYTQNAGRLSRRLQNKTQNIQSLSTFKMMTEANEKQIVSQKQPGNNQVEQDQGQCQGFFISSITQSAKQQNCNNFIRKRSIRIRTQQNKSASCRTKNGEKNKNRGFLNKLQEQIDLLLQNQNSAINVGKKQDQTVCQNKSGSFHHKNEQKSSQSIQKMRRAAMLHYKKVQKMKRTQSKFWQLTMRVEKKPPKSKTLNQLLSTHLK